MTVTVVPVPDAEKVLVTVDILHRLVAVVAVAHFNSYAVVVLVVDLLHVNPMAFS